MTTRPALGPCVSFKLDEDTHLKLVNAKERSGRSKAGEVVLRVKDHLLRYPDFYPTVTYKSVSFGPVVMARFDEDTNKKLIAAKNKSNRSKSHEVYLRLKAHLFEFPDFYS
ncbi:TPA: TraY domain-containing protein, partial [Klebsiella pneumoniae]|nr:TraY domain-containing protein [Klebsiella pneumoniae]